MDSETPLYPPPPVPLECETRARKAFLFFFFFVSARLCSLHVYVKHLEQMASIGWNNTDKSGRLARLGQPPGRWQEERLHYSINSWKGAHFMQHLWKHAFGDVEARPVHERTHTQKKNTGNCVCILGKDWTPPSILPNQIYSESKLKGTFNQPLWVCLSIWEQQQSSRLGVV